MNLRVAARVMCFTLAPMMTDAHGLAFAVYSLLVTIGAAYGWEDRNENWD